MPSSNTVAYILDAFSRTNNLATTTTITNTNTTVEPIWSTAWRRLDLLLCIPASLSRTHSCATGFGGGVEMNLHRGPRWLESLFVGEPRQRSRDTEGESWLGLTIDLLVDDFCAFRLWREALSMWHQLGNGISERQKVAIMWVRLCASNRKVRYFPGLPNYNLRLR